MGICLWRLLFDKRTAGCLWTVGIFKNWYVLGWKLVTESESLRVVLNCYILKCADQLVKHYRTSIIHAYMQVQYKEMVHIMGKDQDLLLTSLVAAMTTTSTIAPEEILDTSWALHSPSWRWSWLRRYWLHAVCCNPLTTILHSSLYHWSYKTGRKFKLQGDGGSLCEQQLGSSLFWF